MQLIELGRKRRFPVLARKKNFVTGEVSRCAEIRKARAEEERAGCAPDGERTLAIGWRSTNGTHLGQAYRLDR